MMENENKNVDKIIERLQNGVREIFEGDNFKHYLEVMAKFHTFSSYNWQLIYEQCPNATKLAGYVQWQRDFNRHVKKGEKAIRILAPRFGKGGMRGFKEVCIFDISQTEGDPLPKTGIEVRALQGNYDSYEILFNALEKISPLPIEFGKLDTGVRGTCYIGKKIVISVGMSQLQNTETLIHEIAHELLHNGSNKDRNTKEVEAESVAYAVCSYFNLDTSDYSLGYVAGWSKDKKLDILRSSLETITKTANEIISDVLVYLGEESVSIDVDAEDDEQRDRELYELGMSYYNEKNYESAVKYFEQAAELGNEKAEQQLFWAKYFLANQYCYDEENIIDKKRAYELYKELSDDGFDIAYSDLGDCYFYGWGVEQNYNEAVDCYYSYYLCGGAYDNGQLENLIELLLLGFGKEQLGDDLINILLECTENNDSKAQLMLGNCYYNGYYVDVDYAEALSWREKAAEQGDAQAQLLVAQQYFSGIGTLRDINKAIHWYNLSAENSNAEAQYQLAELLETGSNGIRKDLSTAFYWYKKAAEADNLNAIIKVGQMYDFGLGTSKNVDQAVYWYQKAAARNSIDAMFGLANIYMYIYHDVGKCISSYEKILGLTRNNKLKALIMTKLGEFYSLGVGVKQSSYKAMYYYRDAVANGSADAAYLLGNVYLEQKNYGTHKRAIEVFMLGADSGSIACQKKLAELYLNGTVVQKSKDNAIKWLAEAAKNGDIESEMKMLDLIQINGEIQQSTLEESNRKIDDLNSEMTEKLSNIFS